MNLRTTPERRREMSASALGGYTIDAGTIDLIADVDALIARVAELEALSSSWIRMNMELSDAVTRYRQVLAMDATTLRLQEKGERGAANSLMRHNLRTLGYQHARTVERNARLRRHIERLLTICRARKAEVKNLLWRDEAATKERVGWIEKCRELQAENERLMEAKDA